MFHRNTRNGSFLLTWILLFVLMMLGTLAICTSDQIRGGRISIEELVSSRAAMTFAESAVDECLAELDSKPGQIFGPGTLPLPGTGELTGDPWGVTFEPVRARRLLERGTLTGHLETVRLRPVTFDRLWLLGEIEISCAARCRIGSGPWVGGRASTRRIFSLLPGQPPAVDNVTIQTRLERGGVR